MTQVRSIAGDTVGTILYRHLGRDDDEIERAFFEINPGVAALGPVLSSGVVVTLPELPAPPVKKVVSVWD